MEARIHATIRDRQRSRDLIGQRDLSISLEPKELESALGECLPGTVRGSYLTDDGRKEGEILQKEEGAKGGTRMPSLFRLPSGKVPYAAICKQSKNRFLLQHSMALLDTLFDQ